MALGVVAVGGVTPGEQGRRWWRSVLGSRWGRGALSVVQRTTRRGRPLIVWSRAASRGTARPCPSWTGGRCAYGELPRITRSARLQSSRERRPLPPTRGRPRRWSWGFRLQETGRRGGDGGTGEAVAPEVQPMAASGGADPGAGRWGFGLQEAGRRGGDGGTGEAKRSPRRCNRWPLRAEPTPALVVAPSRGERGHPSSSPSASSTSAVWVVLSDGVTSSAPPPRLRVKLGRIAAAPVSPKSCTTERTSTR